MAKQQEPAPPAPPSKTKWGHPTREAGRPAQPDLTDLLEARGPNGEKCPIFVQNLAKDPKSNPVMLLINYKDFGSAHGDSFKLPATETPFPLHERMGHARIATSGNLQTLVATGKVRLFWPDEVAYGQDQKQEINEAIAFANNPNQEGYKWRDPARDDKGVQLLEDPEWAAQAQAMLQQHPRVMVLVKGLQEGTNTVGRVFRELQGLQASLSETDYRNILSGLIGNGEGEAKLRQWAATRLTYLQSAQRTTGAPVTPGQKILLDQYARTQFPGAGSRQLDIPGLPVPVPMRPQAPQTEIPARTLAGPVEQFADEDFKPAGRSPERAE